MSEDNVVELFEKPLDVKNIEKLLEFAKSGRLIGLVMVGQLSDGNLISGFSLHKSAKPYSIMGRLMSVANEIDKYHA